MKNVTSVLTSVHLLRFQLYMHILVDVRSIFCNAPVYLSPLLTCYDDPLWHLHQSCVNGQGLLKWQSSCLLVRGHLEGLGDSHALADPLCVLQLIMDAVHLSHICRGGGEGWPTHPACRHIRWREMEKHLKILNG